MAPNPLPFLMQPQECTEWCWAAVVSSVAAFVGADQQPQQCEIVDREAFSPGNPSPGCCKQANRCTPGMTNQICNCRGNVGIVLADYNLTTDPSGQVPTGSDFASIQGQIDGCSVVVIQVVDRSNPGMEHVMVITGYSDDDTVCVADPAEADTQLTYSYSALLSPIAGPSGDSNWQLVKLFMTIPGACANDD
jgi:hypothetical protein